MKALLVIDMLNDFILDDGRLTNGENGKKIISFSQEKIREYRDRGDKIIYICDRHEEDDKEFQMFPKHCVVGTKGSEIIKELVPKEGDKVIYKRRYSGFFGTELDLYLREKDIREISIIGVCTNICVLYTTADARNLSYIVNIYEDGVASFNMEAHKFALGEMASTLGANIIR